MSTFIRTTNRPALRQSSAVDDRRDLPARHLPATAGRVATGAEPRLPARVLHVAGHLTPEVMGFLGPASTVLEQAGVEQVLITWEALPRVQHGENDAPLRSLAASVRCVAAAAPARPWSRLKGSVDLLVASLQGAPQAVVHAHGFIAALVTQRARARAGLRGAAGGLVYYSPHGSASLGRLRPLGMLLQWLARALTGAAPFNRVITTFSAEAKLMPGGRAAPVHLAESPVARCFFEQRREPTAVPLVLSGALEAGDLAAERAARLAVLLGDETMRVRVRWIGLVSPVALPLLRAAGIEVTPAGHTVGEWATESEDNDLALATEMGRAWIFVAPVAAMHFPLLLAQAMAAGMPCVALDSPFNGALLRDGETGFLCKDLEQVLRRTRELVESAPLRGRLGHAARQEAARRFNESLFKQSLLFSYAVPHRAPALAGADVGSVEPEIAERPRVREAVAPDLVAERATDGSPA